MKSKILVIGSSGSLGKQIISWGSASANSPTDIISPYNYYYLFSNGKEQKEGLISIN